MTFLPIVDRELRVAARRRSTYWSRVVVALLVMGVGICIYLMGWEQSPAEVSKVMFVGLTIVVGLFCLVSGTQTTADCLSEEKRDGTLGLLFLTDLSGFDVVAGKLVASSLNAFYGLLASLPMLAVPLLMGGVTGAEFWRIALVLVNTMFFSLAAGMVASAFTRESRHAAVLCSIIVVTMAGLLPLIAAILSSAYNLRNHHAVIGLLLPSPGYAFTVGFAANFRGEEDYFWTSLVLVHCLAWLFLVTTCLVVPRSWQDKAATVTQLRWRDRWMRWSLGDTQERAQFRARLLDVNAFYWLASRSRTTPAMVWAVLGLLAGAWLWAWAQFGRNWMNIGTHIATGLLLNTLLKGWFASTASAQLAEDRRTGALELLLSTPLDARAILHGQFLALCRQFLWPVVFAVGVELVLMLSALDSNDVRGGEGEWVMVWAAAWLMLPADLVALFYVSQWQALKARSSNRANSSTLARVLALPWIVFGLFLILDYLMLVGSRSGPGLEFGFFVFVWLLIGLGVDAFFGLRAKSHLETEFRDVATTRYAKPESTWKRWLRPGDAAPARLP